MVELATSEQIADREADQVVDYIRKQILHAAEHMDVTRTDEPLLVAGAVQAMGQIMADIDARRHRMTAGD